MNQEVFNTHSYFINAAIIAKRVPTLEDYCSSVSNNSINFNSFYEYISANWPWLYYKRTDKYKCTKPQDYWENKTNRHLAINYVYLVENKKNITRNSFKKHNAFNMLRNYYDEQPLNALKEAIDEDLVQLTPWKAIKQLPKNYWSEKNRIKAIKIVFDNYANKLINNKLKTKVSRKISRANFKNEELLTIINNPEYYNGSCFSAINHLYEYLEKNNELKNLPEGIKKVYKAIKECPWTIVSMPNHYWELPLNRYLVVRWIERLESKKGNKLDWDSFHNHALGGMIQFFGEKVSLLNILKETFAENQELQKHPHKYLKKMPNDYWANKEVREEAIKDLYLSEKKDITELTFEKYMMKHMIEEYYEASPLKALQEVIKDEKVLLQPWEVIKNLPTWWLDDENNQYRLLKEMFDTRAEKLSLESIACQGIKSLLETRFNSSPHKALEKLYELLRKKRELNFEYEKIINSPWEILEKVPKFYFDDESKRIKAIKWVFEKEGGKDITRESFKKHNLDLIMDKYYNYNLLKTLQAAYPDNAKIQNSPWEILTQLPNNYWNEELNRHKALQWLNDSIFIDELKSLDLIKNRLSSLYLYYEGGINEAREEFESIIK
ncbi:MAG: hypothetical protein WC376_01980 [Candidatus Nanoarchaeia archaeon]|jgi:hypothetical protein